MLEPRFCRASENEVVGTLGGAAAEPTPLKPAPLTSNGEAAGSNAPPLKPFPPLPTAEIMAMRTRTSFFLTNRFGCYQILSEARLRYFLRLFLCHWVASLMAAKAAAAGPFFSRTLS